MILDAGASTGMVGEVLTKLGYANLVAMDLSQGILEVARQKNVYQELHQMVTGEVKEIDIPASLPSKYESRTLVR